MHGYVGCVRAGVCHFIKSNKYKDIGKNFVKLYYIKSNILWIIIKNHNFQMILSTFHLFSTVCPGMPHLQHELDKPTLRHTFILHSLEIQLTLTENYILITKNP